MTITSPIIPAHIEWRDELPYSPEFDDVFFSKENGMAETRHVFLEGNRLAERFSKRRRFVIGETGFGTGLNFLCAYRLWRKEAPPGARLIYFSIEKHPLKRDDLQRAHALWPELSEEAAWLRVAYPAATPGFHLRHLPGGMTLILALGDVAGMLAEFEGRCDAWFLDGFSPARNPGMWQERLWQLLADRTAEGGTLATFTAAGEVRRGLSSAGFEVARVPGFGGKRHMTVAHRAGGERDPIPPRNAIVIGAGIAGGAAARALAERGVRVMLLEKGAAPAAGGSGNPAAILFPLLQKEWHPAARFYIAAYEHLLDRLRSMPESLRQGLIGMVQLPKKQRGIRDAEGLRAIPARLGLPAQIARAVDADEASRLAGVKLPLPGLYFEQGGWMNLRDMTRHLIDHPLIETHCSSNVRQVEKIDEAWGVSTDRTSFETPRVIFANALGNIDFHESLSIIRPLRGQVSHLSQTERTSVQKKAICFGGYLLPAIAGRHVLGATYEPGESSAEIRLESHRDNLAKLAEALPELAAPWQSAGDPENWSGWAGFRAVSPDRLPLIGALDAGAYATLAHGSRGAVSALLAGEIVAALACGEPLPVERSVLDRFRPQRFSPKK